MYMPCCRAHHNIHHRLRFTWQVPKKDNSKGEYLRVQASGFRGTKFHAVIFRPKKRSGIAVRVRVKYRDLASEATYDA